MSNARRSRRNRACPTRLLGMLVMRSGRKMAKTTTPANARTPRTERHRKEVLMVDSTCVVVLQLEMPADEGDGGAGKSQFEDLEERDERADERPDPVAEDAQLVGEDRRRDEAGQHDGHRQHVVRRDVAADARLLGPPARRRAVGRLRFAQHVPIEIVGASGASPSDRASVAPRSSRRRRPGRRRRTRFNTTPTTLAPADRSCARPCSRRSGSNFRASTTKSTASALATRILVSATPASGGQSRTTVRSDSWRAGGAGGRRPPRCPPGASPAHRPGSPPGCGCRWRPGDLRGRRRRSR